MRKVIRSLAGLALTILGVAAVAADNRVARGEYLVRFGGCNDCHTPGYFLGKPDSSRFLGGSDVGFNLPGAGTFVGPNLTPSAWEPEPQLPSLDHEIARADKPETLRKNASALGKNELGKTHCYVSPSR